MKCFLLLCLSLITLAAQACNFSSLEILNITDNGGSYTIELAVNIGGGILGTNQGADGPTRTFALGAIGDGVTPLSIVGFAPASLASDTTGCTYNSTQFNNAFGTEVGVAYISSGCDFACVSSTAVCGTPHASTYIVSITFNELPTSIQAFGLEGSGNPVAGCYNQPDTIVYPLMFLPLNWGALEGERTDNGQVRLSWRTSSETNTSHFTVYRSEDGVQFLPVGELAASGYAMLPRYYDFTDLSAPNKRLYYYISQVDQDGSYTSSPTLFVQRSDVLSVKLYPNPGTTYVSIECSEEAKVKFMDTQGRLLLSLKTSSVHERIDTSNFPSGTYMVSVTNENGIDMLRWVKK